VQAEFRGAPSDWAQPDEQLEPWLNSWSMRRRRSTAAAWPTLLGFFLVLTWGVLTGCWLSANLNVDLSGMSTLPEALGFTRDVYVPHPTVGYVSTTTTEEKGDANANR
jgi:hypothetical protein